MPSSEQIGTTNKPTPNHFTGRMPFLSPNQQRQTTEGNYHIPLTCSPQAHTGSSIIVFKRLVSLPMPVPHLTAARSIQNLLSTMHGSWRFLPDPWTGNTKRSSLRCYFSVTLSYIGKKYYELALLLVVVSDFIDSFSLNVSSFSSSLSQLGCQPIYL